MTSDNPGSLGPASRETTDVIELRVLELSRTYELADDVTWNLYNALVDEIPQLDSDAGWDAFNEQVGSELTHALRVALGRRPASPVTEADHG